MSTGLFLALVYTLVPLGVILIAVAARPLLQLPARFSPRLSEAAAYTGGVATALGLGLTLIITIGLWTAFRTSGTPLPSLGEVVVSRAMLYLALMLFGVPLAVVGLISASHSLLIKPQRPPTGLGSRETLYALSVAGLVNLGILADLWLMARLALG